MLAPAMKLTAAVHAAEAAGASVLAAAAAARALGAIAESATMVAAGKAVESAAQLLRCQMDVETAQEELSVRMAAMAPATYEQIKAGEEGRGPVTSGRCKAARNVGAHWKPGAGEQPLKQALANPQLAQRGGRRHRSRAWMRNEAGQPMELVTSPCGGSDVSHASETSDAERSEGDSSGIESKGSGELLESDADRSTLAHTEDADDTSGDVPAELRSECNGSDSRLQQQQQRLMFTEKLLEDGQLRIYVEIMAGHGLPLDVRPDDTIDAVMDKIQDAAGIPWERQRLEFEGQMLKDHRTISDCRIHHEAKLRCLDVDGGFAMKKVDKPPSGTKLLP